jgi:hypothetical protein
MSDRPAQSGYAPPPDDLLGIAPNDIQEGTETCGANGDSESKDQGNHSIPRPIEIQSIPSGSMKASPIHPLPTSPMAVAEARAKHLLPEFLKKASHPWVCFFHLLFKLLAVSSYWLIYLFTRDVTLTFILTSTFLAMDFWVVKNVSGRILVGLRWWNLVKDDGSSEWLFESAGREDVSAIDRNVFWAGLFVFPIYWGSSAISNLLSLSPNFFILSLMGLSLSGTNAFGYSKCSRSGSARVQQWATAAALQAFTSQSTSSNNV